ncbi:MAG TPA: adenylate/guanylate cyclase domain-containing protein [Candidatus Limnocylindrales bacterium]|nr:adenylate/guanylate cyclase domain-containing protein [Candidatus Limnocylindrales bacterium]
MNCPTCGTFNEPGRKFCGECGTRLAAVCPSCGTPNSAGTKFCGECGTPMADAATPAGAGTGAGAGVGPAGAGLPSAARGGVPVAERRLVSILFADLVGFTTLSEGRDPEEVRELLSRYFDAAREQITRYGGTVEKFIGDAVMAVWGAPTAHEDDAERAVRAALEVVDAVRSLAPGLEARAGVLTGEAAVTVGATNQGMVAGDLVNTASRLQSVAPAGVVLVGESTKRATENSIAYEPAGDHVVKGKTAPVTAFRAMRVVAERGGRGRGDRLEAPFVGRETELRLLKDLSHTTAREKRIRLVSITGQGGIGKSRLAWELKKYLDGVAETVFWHEGRSPAYGEGITFWALGEMIRARADISELDDPASTRAKLGASVARYVSDPADRERVERALATLLGVGDASNAGSGAGELYSAWRLFFERMAEQQMVVLLFEDLHWADPGLLDFIDHMLEWSRGLPILIVTLARPELLERRPDWGAGRRNFLALDLEPLDDTSMRQLLAGFVPGLPEAAIRSIVARAEGIPLYAVETIRMLVADGRLEPREDGGYEPVGELGELAVPDTLHALIAARLDGLDPAERSLIQDAAVLGQSFTPAGLAAVSGLEPAVLAARLRVLVRSDLILEELDPRSPERGQYHFVQALIREVAYSTLSLKDRRTRHLAAARFFESIGDDELAGALAAHYVAAYRATPAGDEAKALATQARIALRAAADRALALGSPRQAVTFLAQALEVEQDDADRAVILERTIRCAIDAALYAPALDLAPELREIRERMGDRSGLALAIMLQGEAYDQGREREKAVQLGRETVGQFEDMEDDPNVLRLYAGYAGSLLFTRHYAESAVLADRTLALAERLGDGEVATRLLRMKGMLAQFQGRIWEAIALVQGARRLAEQLGLQNEVDLTDSTLTNVLALDDPRGSVEVGRRIIDQARRTGHRNRESLNLGNTAEDMRRTGEWDWVMRELDGAIRDEDRNVTDLYLEHVRASFLILRGLLTPEDLADLSTRTETLGDPDMAASMHDLGGLLAFVDGRFIDAAHEFIVFADGSDLNAPYALPRAGLAAVLGSDVALARQVLERIGALGTRGRAIETDISLVRAGIMALEGDHDTAMAGYRIAWSRYGDLGLPYDQGLVALVAAATVGSADPEVAGWLGEARAIFERLKATPLLAMVDAQAASVWSGRSGATSGARAAASPEADVAAEAERAN